MALSRGMTALRAALGAVGGGLEGYAQMQELERRRKKEEEAASLQREMTRFNALQAAGARFELPRQTPDAAARSATALEMPEMPGPMTAAGQQSMLGRALQAGMGVSKAPTGGLDTPIQLALDTTRTRQFERGAAMQPAVPQERIRIGGLDLAVRAPETEEEKFARELKKYEAQLGVQEGIAARKGQRELEQERQRAERMADLYTKTYTDQDGRPISRDQAMAAALNNKTPFDMGFVEKPMSNAEKVRLSLDSARFNLSQKEYDLRLREQNRRESDSQRRRESMPVGAQRRLEGLDSGVLLVGDVREMLKSAPESIGPVKGRVFSSVLDAADKKGVAVRAAIESMAGEIRNQRFGAALTASEAKFAEQFLPGAKDSYETAMSKLDQLDRYLETKRKGVFMTYQQEYRPIYAPTGASPAAGGAANPYR